jgi:PPOX class probable F420-dependent enzyme
MADVLSDEAHKLIESAAVATLVTLDGDGAPHISSAWIGLEEGEIVIGTLADQRKLRNIRRDPRVALSVLSDRINQWGLREYLVMSGTARITDGGAPELLQRLARTYLGPDEVFPAMPDPPAGYVIRIRIERVSGVGPWSRGWHQPFG